VQSVEAKSCRRRIIGGGKEQQAIGSVAVQCIESKEQKERDHRMREGAAGYRQSSNTVYREQSSDRHPPPPPPGKEVFPCYLML
jgi:hypothetical protein